MRWFHPRREGQRFSLPATANATQEPHTLSKESRSRDSFPESRGAAVRMGQEEGRKVKGEYRTAQLYMQDLRILPTRGIGYIQTGCVRSPIAVGGTRWPGWAHPTIKPTVLSESSVGCLASCVIVQFILGGTTKSRCCYFYC